MPVSLETRSRPTNLQPPRIIDIPTKVDSMGDLSFVEAEDIVPFEIRRTYFITGIPALARRGGHAHKDLFEFIIAVHGAFTVKLQDQEGNEHEFRLDSPAKGLFVDSLYWRELFDYDEGSACLVLASNHYDEADYLRDFDEFLQYRAQGDAPGTSQ